MSGASESPDPFAGYTPVKVAPVAEPATLPTVDAKRPRKYRFGKKRESGLSRTVKFFGLVGASAALVALIAVLAYGFIYERPVDEPILGVEAVTNCVRRLSELGREARVRVRTVMPTGTGETSAERRASSSETDDRTLAEKVFPILGTVLNQSRRMKESSRLLDDAESAPAASVVPTDGAVEVEKGTVHPELKRFKGGHSGRTLETGGLR